MRTVIIANGQLENHPRLRKIWRDADFRIAADGGATNAHKHLTRAPHIVIGDFDSIDAATRAWCEKALAEFIRHPRTKDQTDLELAIHLAIARGASDITLLGALGKRFDHTLANALLLIQPLRAHIPARIASADFDAWLAAKRTTIAGKIGETVSLIPLTARVERAVTRGLQYPLRSETLVLGSPRGVSNVLTATRATVSFPRGILLVVHLRNRKVVDKKLKDN